MKRHLKQKQLQAEIGVQITTESLIAMLNLCKSMAENLMTLIDQLQQLANVKSLSQRPSRTK